MRRTVTEQQYSVDQMMQSVALSLFRDFQTNLRDPTFCSDHQLVVKTGDIGRVREFDPGLTYDEEPSLFKAKYQIASIFKRYRFRKDLYSDEELTVKAIRSFQDTQRRIACVDLDNVDANTTLVLDLAAVYIAKVLGVYSDEEHRNLCRSGKRATIGVPARTACEAARWELPISGSVEQIAWFDSEMSEAECVQEYWAAQQESDRKANRPVRSIYRVTSSLKLTLVPKTFKSLRAIMPNTTIGSYMSYGLGMIMRKRLKRAGYDLSTLQERHRLLASQGSVHGSSVTADLSSASDSISVALVERLFPPDWCEILRQSRIGQVVLPDGTICDSNTYCTMGIGYTFPLQTLVFLALLKAIEYLDYGRLNRRTISVYGDDLIYSSRMHNKVVRYFQAVGFVINLDKTFHEGNFRESCGGDYYRGVDVRPFQPQNGQASVGKVSYEAVLYKCINGLLMRWTEYEIANTLDYLTDQLEFVAGKCKLVPHDFPDEAGIKCSYPIRFEFLKRTKCALPKHIGHGLFRFSYLRFTPSDREEERHAPYLWKALRRQGSDDHNHYHDYRTMPEGCIPDFRIRLDSLIGIRDDASELVSRVLKPIQFVRSNLTHKRLRRIGTFVTVSHTGRYKRQSGLSCFESRR